MPRRSGRHGASTQAAGRREEDTAVPAASAPNDMHRTGAASAEAEQVDVVKVHMSRLHTRDEELLEVIEEATAVCDAAIRRAVAERDAVIERANAEREAVCAEMAPAEKLLNVRVNAPVSGRRDPFEWLPDELIVMILLMLPGDVLWGKVCERVCQRWARLMESALVKRCKRDGRWAAYEAGVIEPRELEGHDVGVNFLTVGLDGKIYSASDDRTVRVWSGADGTHLRTLQGHTDFVRALAVGLGGKIYSGSSDTTIRVWSGEDGAHLQTLQGHTGCVWALAVGLGGKIYSGSDDTTIRVWSGGDVTHLQTLEGHEGGVFALAVGLDGKIYSGSADCTIRVWSGDDGAHLQTLEGHNDTVCVCALAVGLDGKIYSGSFDTTIQVWSGDDGAHLQTLHGHEESVNALAVGLDGKIYSGSADFTIRVWSGEDGTHLHTLDVFLTEPVLGMTFGRDGSLFSCSLWGSDAKNMLMW
jgi:WD40 repeat protein